ncbi:MAG TPA: ATP-binding protein [Actinophytocola sp.]|nr:ATP-binding protein [Actinophytocola sp.]
MSTLDGFQFHRLTVVPRADDPAESTVDRPPADGGRAPAQLFAALTAAHAELDGRDGAVAVAWDRLGGQRIRVLVGGRPYLPAARSRGDGETPVLYPPGSLGVAVETSTLAAQWSTLPVWTRCPGAPDPLWTPGAAEPGGAPARGGFDDYVAHLPGDFAWLVVAEPRSAAAAERELLGLETRLPRLRQMENSELDRVRLLRAEGRYRELSRAQTAGTWAVHVFVGGTDEHRVRSAAALLCSASDLDTLPYVLTPGAEFAGFAEIWEKPVDNGGEDPRSPFTATSELIAAVARPPRRELPGIRMVEQPYFDLTPETEGDVHLGSVLDDADQPIGEFAVSLDTINRHTFVAGATGSGKSQTVRHLLEGLHQAKIRWLVIEPAKAEYAGMAGRLGEAVTVIRPGDPKVYPAGLNPLEPEPGFPLQTHLDLTRALFLAAFDADEPFPQVLAHALTRCYTDLGWDPVTGRARLAGGRPKYPSLGDLQSMAKEVVKGIGYGREVADNIRGFVDVRIGSLRLGTPGRFFEGGHPLDIAELLRRNVVLEIEDIGSDSDKAFFIGAVIIRLFEHLRLHPAAGLRHVTVLEEAHRLLKHAEPGSPAAHAVELFTSLLAEIRAYGEGIIVAEQIPSKIVPDVVKNTACKIMHRLPAADDRTTVGATMNLSEAQSRHVVSLSPGRAAVFTDGMDRPLRVAMPLRQHAESSSAVDRDAPVLGFRSVTCGVSCRASRCTLDELNNATHVGADPRLVLWIELLTVAHLTGRAAPSPSPDWVASLHAHGRRTLECAVGHRVQEAIDSRYVGLSRHYAPSDLAAHLAASAFATLDGAPVPCDGTEFEWQAANYRWYDVLMALKAPVSVDDAPHPDTAAWAARGLVLPGGTRAKQLASLRLRPDYWQADRVVLQGNGTPPAYEAAVSRLAREPDPVARFRTAAKYLNLRTNWAVKVLQIGGQSERGDRQST